MFEFNEEDEPTVREAFRRALREQFFRGVWVGILSAVVSMILVNAAL